MKTYRVVINHKAGHLAIHTVEAANKSAADKAVRALYSNNGLALGRTSSVTAVNTKGN